MKNKIAKIALALNIIALFFVVILNLTDFDINHIESNKIALAAFLALAGFALFPPLVYGVLYLLGAAAAGDCMIISCVASLLTSIVISACKNRSNFILLFLNFFVYAVFAIIKHRRKITKKHVARVLLAALAVGAIHIALKIENIIRDVKITKYDEQCNKISFQIAGLKTLYEYQNGKLVKEIQTWVYDFPVTVFEYDENGNKILEKKVSKDGKSEKTGAIFKYNEKNQLVMTWNDWSEVYNYYFYDEKGQKIKEVCDGKETLFEYDDNGKLIKQTEPDGNIYYFEYDEDGKLIKRTEYGKVWHYEYNENGTLAKRFCDTEFYEVEYFEDEPEKKRRSILKKMVDGELKADFELKFDREDNIILCKDERRVTRYFYPTLCTHWKDGSIKTKRVYEIRIGW